MAFTRPDVPFKLTAQDMGVANLPQAVAAGGSVVDQMIGSRLKEMQAKEKEAEITAGVPQATARYKNAMSDYLMSPGGQGRGLSPTGKIMNEMRYYAQPTITDPSTGQQIDNPLYSKKMANYQSTGDPVQDTYNMVLMKQATDADARKKNLAATNVEKTIAKINPEVVTSYSGILGGAEKFANQVSSGLGLGGSANYDKYVDNKANIDLLVKQIRQFYGDSIQPAMQQKLSQITDPSSWDKSPKQAKSALMNVLDTLHRELSTYRQAMSRVQTFGRQPLFEGGGQQQGQAPGAMSALKDPSMMTDAELRAELGK